MKQVFLLVLVSVGCVAACYPCVAESWGGVDVVCNVGPELLGESVFSRGAYFRSTTGTVLGIEGHGYAIGPGGVKFGGWGGGLVAYGPSLPAQTDGATLQDVIGCFGGALIGLTGRADAVVLSINARLGVGALVFMGTQGESSNEALSGLAALYGGLDAELGYAVTEFMIVSLYAGVHATAALGATALSLGPGAAPVMGLRIVWRATKH